MFNGHKMTCVMDLGVLGPFITSPDIVIAAVTTEDIDESFNMFSACILVPETDTIMRWADGDQLAMINEYPRYLLTKEPDEMIVALIAAMTKKNIVLYIPRDEFNIFGNILLNHLGYWYGITVENLMGVQFSVNYSKIPFLYTKFYLADLMTPDDYLVAYPYNIELPTEAAMKLAQQLNPFNRQASYQECVQYFNELRRNMQNKQNSGPINIIDIL